MPEKAGLLIGRLQPIRLVIVTSTVDEAASWAAAAQQPGRTSVWSHAPDRGELLRALERGADLVLVDPSFRDLPPREIWGVLQAKAPSIPLIVHGNGSSPWARPEAAPPGVRLCPPDGDLADAVRQALLPPDDRPRDLRDEILDLTLEGIVREDPDGRLSYVNRAAADMLGYTPGDLLGTDRALIVPPDQDRLVEEANQRRREGLSDRYELELIHHDGQRVPVLVSGSPILRNGVLEGTIAVFTDLREWKQTQEDLRRSKDSFQRLIQACPIPVVLIDPEANVRLWNPAAERVFGWMEAEVVGSPMPFVPPGSREESKKLVERGRRGEWIDGLEIVRQRKDGTRLNIRLSTAPMRTADGDFDGILGLLVDITEAKKTETALRESEGKFRTLAEESPNMIFINRGGRVLYANRAAAEVMGYERHEFAGIDFDFRQLVAPESRQVVEANYRRHLAGSEVPPTLYTLLTKDGRRVEGLHNTRLVEFAGDTAILGIITDLTEARKQEQALAESEARYRALTENSAVGIYRTTADGEILFANPAAVRMLGFDSFADLAGRNLEEEGFEPGYPRADFKRRLERDGEVIGLESAWRRRDDSTIYVRESARLVRDDDGSPLYYEGTVEDVTDRKRAEEALEEHARELEWLYRTSLEVIASDDLEALLRTVVERASGVIGCKQGGLYLVDPGGASLTLVVSHNYSKDYTGTVLRLGEGVSGRVAESGEVMVIEDYQTFADQAAAYRGIEIRRLLAVPLKVAGRVIGVLNVGDSRVGGFSEEEIHLVHLFADQAALGLENARLLSAERERTKQLERARGLVEALSTVAAEAQRVEDPDDVMHMIGEQLHAMGLQGWVAQAEAESGDLLVRYASVDSGLLRRAAELVRGPVIGYRIRRSGLAVFEELLDARRALVVESETLLGAIAPDVPRAVMKGLLRMLRIEPGMVTLCLPLAVEDHVLGGLFVWGEGLSDRDLPAFSIFAGQIAGVMEKMRLLEETRRRATYLEGITGVSTALRVAGTRADMLPIILDQLLALLKAEGAAIERLGPQPGEVTTELGRGAWQGWTRRVWSAAGGVRAAVLRGRRPLQTSGSPIEAVFAGERDLAGLLAVVCAPLIVQDEAMGLIWVGRHTAFSETEEQTLAAVADMTANALHRAGVMETLEERVHARTLELQQANARLTELDQLKGEFVSNVSHELRTPITNIQLYLDLLRRPTAEARRDEYMATLDGQARRLGRLIEDLLALSRLDAGMVRLNLEAHLLDGLMAEVVQAHQARADAKGVSLLHEPHAVCPPAWVSREQMMQVLTNLVSNAVAYSPRGGRVVVETICGDPTERRVGARVWNDGPSIPAEDLPHLFERFFRGQTGRASGEPGTGLGLAICREIVERHQGRIEVESTEEGGTTFTVWVPASGL